MSENLSTAPRNASFSRDRPVWTVTVPQAAWLKTTSSQYGVDPTVVASALVTHANRQPPGTKKYIFLVVRCQNCGAGGQKGGFKTTVDLTLEDGQVSWLEAVQKRCKHKSVDKTMRIILGRGACR